MIDFKTIRKGQVVVKTKGGTHPKTGKKQPDGILITSKEKAERLVKKQGFSIVENPATKAKPKTEKKA